jgi:hypothetical protein
LIRGGFPISRRVDRDRYAFVAETS